MAVKAKVSITISRLIDISTVTRYYLLQSSTSAAPAKPTTNPPSSGWTKTEPSYTSGSTNTLYFTDCTEFTDGSFKYSEVSKSSSYEAAKEAYNKAAAVETRVTNAETAITQNKNAIALRATKTEVTNYVASRGENLVTNGTAFLGDNTNFPGFTYDGAESYYSGGSFKVTGKVATMFTDEPIPVDVSQAYTLSYWIKSDSATAKYYDMLSMYDVDKNSILAKHIMWVDGSTTTLAQDLNDGDTVVYLQNIAGFNKTLTSYWNRGFIIWNYKNSKGYQYGVETYSRNVYSPLWDDATAFDAENNTITLKQAWTHGKIPAGTCLSQCSDGGTYKYFNGNYSIPADTWSQKTGTISGVGKNNESKKFREGTAFVKVGWCLNYYTGGQPPTVTTRISTVSLTQNAGIAELNDAKNDISTLSKTVTDYYTTLQTNSNSIVASVEKLKTDTTNDIDGLRDNISTLNEKVELQMTESQVDLRIDSKLQNGVTKVETETGFKFDADGLNISKSNSPTNTQITENGMTVRKTEDNKAILTADKDGVDAVNLKASTYLIIGGRSRFENYLTNRTACFWIGPSSDVSYPITNPNATIATLATENAELKQALETISDELDTVT